VAGTVSLRVTVGDLAQDRLVLDTRGLNIEKCTVEGEWSGV